MVCNRATILCVEVVLISECPFVFFDLSASTNLNDSVVSSVCGEEDGDDAEYNYLADQMDEEKEEFRDDRAVRISSELSLNPLLYNFTIYILLLTEKEVDDLLNEYLYSVSVVC